MILFLVIKSNKIRVFYIRLYHFQSPAAFIAPSAGVKRLGPLIHLVLALADDDLAAPEA